MAVKNPERPKFVIDFDGFITELDVAIQSYLEPFHRGLAELVGASYSLVQQLFQDAYAEIDTSRELHGWVIDGLIVAPVADPFIRNNAATTLVLQKLGKQVEFAQLVRLHTECMAFLPTVFKPYAKEFLEFLIANTNLTVVTNSETAAVTEKLRALLEKSSVPDVKGGAKKYHIDRQWTEVPETTQPQGFPRPVQLRRKRYDDVLRQIQQSGESQAPIVCVLGDIFELDLVLAEFRGIFTILLATQAWTPQWEREYYADHPNGFSAPTLNAIAHYVVSSHLV